MYDLALIQLSGAIALNQRFHYDAFGKRLDANIADTKLLYRGEWTDASTGLQFSRARYYNPGVGRFTTLDPFAGSLEDPLSLHKYAYANGDPIQHTDPTGMFSVTEINVSGAIGVPFNPTQAEIERRFFTNWASNVAVGHMCQANRLRQVLDFTIRTVSDVWIGEQNLYWTVGINLATLESSEILSKYAGQVLGKAFEKYGCFVAGTPLVTGFDDDASVDSIRDDDGEITIARRATTLAIESIPLGSRVITELPELHIDDDGFGKPNQSTWRKVTMLHHRKDGTVIEMELLRPAEWLTRAGVEVVRLLSSHR